MPKAASLMKKNPKSPPGNGANASGRMTMRAQAGTMLLLINPESLNSARPKRSMIPTRAPIRTGKPSPGLQDSVSGITKSLMSRSGMRKLRKPGANTRQIPKATHRSLPRKQARSQRSMRNIVAIGHLPVRRPTAKPTTSSASNSRRRRPSAGCRGCGGSIR